jgi:hypothetical protein
MGLTEEAMCYLEDHIPELAAAAITQACWAALASDHTVLEAENGTLVEVFPDGSRRFIKHLPLRTKVIPGARYKLL